MQSLKESLLPTETVLDFSRVKTRPRLHALKWQVLTFGCLFSMIIIAYTLIVSLTYQPVPPNQMPAYNATITLYFTLNELGPLMIQQGMLPSVALNKAVFLSNFSFVTDCKNVNITQDSYVYAPATNDASDIGCSLNMTVSYNMEFGQQGQYYLISLNGFSFNPYIYPSIKGDLVLVTSGISPSINYTTEPVFQILSGINGQNVMINTLSNNFTYLVFDFERILLFGMSSFGLLWSGILLLWKIINKMRKEIHYGELISMGDEIYIEV